MRKAILVVLLAACGRSAPEHFSVDASFSASEAATIRSAVEAWCDAAGWCPTEVLRAERGRFELVDSLGNASDSEACADPDGCRVAGNNDGDNVRVARDRPRADDLELLWRIVAHEAGHYCVEHQPKGLMSAYMAPSGEASIDELAVEAWLSGCH